MLKDGTKSAPVQRWTVKMRTTFILACSTASITDGNKFGERGAERKPDKTTSLSWFACQDGGSQFPYILLLNHLNDKTGNDELPLAG